MLDPGEVDHLCVGKSRHSHPEERGTGEIENMHCLVL